MCTNTPPYYHGCWLLNCVLVTSRMVTLLFGSPKRNSNVDSAAHRTLSHFAPGHLKVAQTQRRWRCTWVLFRSVFFFACYSCNLLLWMQPRTVRQWLLEDFLSVFSNVFLKPGAGSKFKMGFHCSNNKSSPFQHLISALCTIFN